LLESGLYFPFAQPADSPFDPRRRNWMPSLLDFFSIVSIEVRKIAAASSSVAEVAAILN
jgi:hypothetical protein